MFAFSAWSDLKEFRQSGPVKYIRGLTGFYATKKKNNNKGFCCLENSNNFRNILLRGIQPFQGSVCEDNATLSSSTFPE
jgi:hypothetical protein